MDLSLILGGTFFADIGIDAPYIKSGDDLQNSVVLSLFLNRLCEKDDVKEGDNRQGWWGDTYAEVNGSRIGSRLWLLQRSKQTDEVANLAREYCLEALQWLIQDKIADSVVVRAENTRMYMLSIWVDIYKPNAVKNFQFDYVWGQF